MKATLLAELMSVLEAKRAVVLATRLSAGEQALLYPLDASETAPEGWPLGAARRALLDDQSIMVSDVDGGDVFLRVYSPPARIILVGAVHIATPLARMAATLGFEVHVVDPRAAFATEGRFPGVNLVRSWPEEALAGLRLDHRTAIVTLTHDAKLDEPALVAALDSPAFYIGALGSRRTHAKRVARLRERGIGEVGIARIHAPVGLDINARTPGEIAVSILAEIVAGLRAERRS